MSEPDDQPHLSSEALEKIEQADVEAGVKVVIVGGHSAFGPSRVHRRLSSSLALAAALILATSGPAVAMSPPSSRKKKAKQLEKSDYPGLYVTPYRAPSPPGMQKDDLQRMQRQHAQKASAKSRYRPR